MKNTWIIKSWIKKIIQLVFGKKQRKFVNSNTSLYNINKNTLKYSIQDQPIVKIYN